MLPTNTIQGIACLDVIRTLPYLVGRTVELLWLNGDSSHSVFLRQATNLIDETTTSEIIRVHEFMQNDKFKCKLDILINSDECGAYLRKYLNGMYNRYLTGTEEDWKMLSEFIRSNDPIYYQ